MTLNLEICQTVVESEYQGKFYVGHKNRLGRMTIYLRTDGVLSDVGGG